MKSKRRIAAALLGHWHASSETEREQGRAWYPNALSKARSLARHTPYTTRQVAAVIAATSPRVYWAQNLNIAAKLITWHMDGDRCTYGMLTSSARAGYRILSGITDVPSGDKVRAFFYAILGEPTNSAVIDVWILRAARIRKARLTHKEYRHVSDALILAAQSVNVPVRDFQAAVWIHCRGRAI